LPRIFMPAPWMIRIFAIASLPSNLWLMLVDDLIH
jgi:hypothetical protein